MADVEGIPYALEIKDYDIYAGLKSFRVWSVPDTGYKLP